MTNVKRHKGLFTGALSLIALVRFFDQFSKWYLLELVNIDERPPLTLMPFFNLVMVWNHGVSFGMFARHDQPLILIAVTSLVVMVLFVWMWREEKRFVVFSIATVIGGAIGNIIDRIRFGAVADFFDFHVAGYHWPAFNIADACIFIGVALLVIHSIFLDKTSSR